MGSVALGRVRVVLVLSLAAALLVPACNKKYSGRTKPSSDTQWHRCELVPEKRSGSTSGTLRFIVKCTAKVDLWIHDMEVVFYDGDEPYKTFAELGEDEKIELAAGQSTERSNGIEVSKLKQPWVVKVRLAFGYPGGMNVENLEADMAAHEKDTRDNPTKFKIELSAAFE